MDEKVRDLWNWIASNMTTGDISSIRRSQAFLPVFKKEMNQYLRSFASTIAEAVREEEKQKAQKIDHSIDVRYEPDVIKAFNKFIKKWCGKWYAHLIDDDENDGQFVREKIEALAEAVRGEERISRVWAMPNKWTFTIKPIKELLKSEVNGGIWIDPFAGKNSPADKRNDLDPTANVEYHLDALEFLKQQSDKSSDGVLYDPPYSITQARMYGKKEFSSMKYWAECKNEIARIVKPNGKVICFGWSSMGLGKNRGFEMTRILLVPHGGSKNDTICTVETKLTALRGKGIF